MQDACPWCRTGKARERRGQPGSPTLQLATQHDQHWMPRREELDAGVDVAARECQQPGRLLRIGSATCTAGQGITSRRRAQDKSALRSEAGDHHAADGTSTRVGHDVSLVTLCRVVTVLPPRDVATIRMR